MLVMKSKNIVIMMMQLTQSKKLYQSKRLRLRKAAHQLRETEATRRVMNMKRITNFDNEICPRLRII